MDSKSVVSKSILEKAAHENIITADQVDSLYQFIQAQSAHAQADAYPISNQKPKPKRKPLKFVRSFGDVFITLGIFLLLTAINMANISGYYYLIPVVGFVGLAEWLVRIRRLVLPGIAILISILFFMNKAIPFGNENTAFLGFGLMSVISLLFYLRYKMPFSLLPLAAGLVALSITQIGFGVLENPLVFVVFGVIIFCVALWFDSQDTTRESNLSDNAFWLHLLASPLIVHGVMISLLMSNAAWLQDINIGMLMMIFFLAFFLLALLIDRRVMLISTQLYMIYALTQLMQDKLDNTHNAIIYILIGLGLFVIYFGTYWYKSRQIIFGFISGSFIRHYVPDLNLQDIKRDS